ncbi:hypothetical protein LCGC14_2118380 [marine sediment metagenome]|uniref:DksA C4-type domain-containing protein n=1 Tax=marine sediment metagenome TaxID=412755 RepID=A0A0F9ES27_9ZZZZ
MDKKQMISKEDAPLYIDIICYSCRRLVALSNTIEMDGRSYCHRCMSYGVGKAIDG